MPVCDDAAAQKLGVCLTKFFTTLDGGKEEVDPTTPAAVSIKATPTPKAKPAPSPRSVASTPPARRAPQPSYSSSSRTPSYGSSSSRYGSSIQGDARSATSRRQDEMKSMFGSGSGGSSVKDRMKAFNNETKINFDPIHFAVNKNKEKNGKYHIYSMTQEDGSELNLLGLMSI